MQWALQTDEPRGRNTDRNLECLFRHVKKLARNHGIKDPRDVLLAFVEDFFRRDPKQRSDPNHPLSGAEPAWQYVGQFRYLYRAVHRLAGKKEAEKVVANLPYLFDQRPRRGGKRLGAGRREINWHNVLSTKVASEQPELHFKDIAHPSRPGVVQDPHHLALRIVVERALRGSTTPEITICRDLLRGAEGPANQPLEYLANALQDRLKSVRRDRREGKASPSEIVRLEKARARVKYSPSPCHLWTTVKDGDFAL